MANLVKKMIHPSDEGYHDKAVKALLNVKPTNLTSAMKKEIIMHNLEKLPPWQYADQYQNLRPWYPNPKAAITGNWPPLEHDDLGYTVIEDADGEYQVWGNFEDGGAKGSW